METGNSLPCIKKPGIGPYSKPHVSSPQLRTPRDQFYCHRAINLYFSLAISFSAEILHQFIVSTIHATGLTHLIFLGVVTLITSVPLHTRDPVLQVPRYVCCVGNMQVYCSLQNKYLSQFNIRPL